MYICSSYATSVRSSYQRIHTPFMMLNDAFGSCEHGWVKAGPTR